jgi:PadR family transcriptional regulator PadR
MSLRFSASDTELLILAILSNNPEGMYGLELIRTSGEKLKRGTVYVTLGRMEEKGFIKSRIDKTADKHPGLPRPIYKITGAGSRVLSVARQLDSKLAEGISV